VSKRLPRAAIAGVLTAVAVASVPLASSAAETKVEQLLFDGHTREYVVSAPTSGRQFPTILALHGTLLNAQRTMNSMGLEPLVDRGPLAVVYMRAVNRCAENVSYSALPDIDPEDGSHVIVASFPSSQESILSPNMLIVFQ
jgi:poly(3-hydroxybutyrate) depolymerase